MFIPLIKKDPEANDFTCRDGEIEFMTNVAPDNGPDGDDSGSSGDDAAGIAADGHAVRFSLTPQGDYPTANIRVPLLSGEKEKAALMLQGQAARVDAATADRITQAIVSKAAQAFYDVAVDRRRLGLYMLPFRVYTLTERRDGTRGLPSAQAVMLPAEYPPHPEITAGSVTDDTLTLSLRFTVAPHRLTAMPPENFPSDCRLLTFVSYPLYIPSAAEITGTLGSVRSATGGTAHGIRFRFLSESSLKHSVAAPEKYYQVTGNDRTGYRMASKAAPAPDYSEYVGLYGYVPPFSPAVLQRAGGDADPFDWIADWERSGGGALPCSLPHVCRSVQDAAVVTPEGVDSELVDTLAAATGMRNVLLTRPMTFADAVSDRRKATPRGVRTLRIHGLDSAASCTAVLLGSRDGTVYEPLRRWNPHETHTLLTPPRLLHRLLLLSDRPITPGLAIELRIEN